MRWLRLASIALLGALFIAAGANHFRVPGFYLPMMPPYLPWHAGLIAVSGVCEILGGLGLLVPRTRCLAAYGLLALLVAVFPANVHMALHDIQPPGTHISPLMAWLRLPLQAILMAWVWWAGARRPNRK